MVKRAERILSGKTTECLLRFGCVAGSLGYTSIPRSPTPYPHIAPVKNGADARRRV